eukprot:TRINITY_DN95052_c0_g1_i1.p1 TRINITY_DN95052_c0_g1~~TRINITY_DN95052_c0_g1_i1.p1  ORF type:complete len:255 (-),score=30.98 TRINITY_DN95052_c0_g1_i1:1-765(-)
MALIISLGDMCVVRHRIDEQIKLYGEKMHGTLFFDWVRCSFSSVLHALEAANSNDKVDELISEDVSQDQGINPGKNGEKFRVVRITSLPYFESLHDVQEDPPDDGRSRSDFVDKYRRRLLRLSELIRTHSGPVIFLRHESADCCSVSDWDEPSRSLESVWKFEELVLSLNPFCEFVLVSLQHGPYVHTGGRHICVDMGRHQARPKVPDGNYWKLNHFDWEAIWYDIFAGVEVALNASHWSEYHQEPVCSYGQVW